MDGDTQAAGSNVVQTAKDDLFSAIGASDLPENDKVILLNKMIGMAQDRAITRLAEESSPEEQKKLEEIAAKDEPDALEEYIEQNLPKFQQIFQEEVLKIRDALIAKFGK